MIANIASATVRGAHGHPVTVEVHVGAGLPGFTMLGLPDEACREARDRVRAAVLSSGFDWPDRRITVNLAPPHHRKTGSGLDLAIAIGVLVAAQRIPPDAVGGLHMVGEVGLDRGIDVLVVPGSPQMPASEGTNMLLRDGAGVVTDVDDVLMALGISHDGCRGVAPVPPPGLPGSGASPHGDVVAVLADGPATLDTLAARTMHSVADVACTVSDLVGAGLVVAEGGWVELAMSRLSGQYP